MTKSEFMRDLQAYYGGFKNDTIRDYFVAEPDFVSGRDYEPLLRQIFSTLDLGRHLSVKVLADACL